MFFRVAITVSLRSGAGVLLEKISQVLLKFQAGLKLIYFFPVSHLRRIIVKSERKFWSWETAWFSGRRCLVSPVFSVPGVGVHWVTAANCGSQLKCSGDLDTSGNTTKAVSDCFILMSVLPEQIHLHSDQEGHPQGALNHTSRVYPYYYSRPCTTWSQESSLKILSTKLLC